MQFDLDKICEARKGNGIPQEFTIGRSIGKGANNEVFIATCNQKKEYVLRKPLKKADSRDRVEALREARYTQLAASIGAAPTVHDIWFVRKSTLSQRRGLYLILEKLEGDLTDSFKNDINFIITNSVELRKQIVRCIYQLAEAGLFCYDLKPANTVYNREPLTVKMIDFGSDYTESLFDDSEGKIVESLRKVAAELFTKDMVDQECKFSFFVVMLIIYSSHLYHTVRSYDLGLHITQMWEINFLVPVIVDLQKNMSELQHQLTVSLLKHKEVRKVFEHYFDGERKYSHEKACRRAHFDLKKYMEKRN